MKQQELLECLARYNKEQDARRAGSCLAELADYLARVRIDYG